MSGVGKTGGMGFFDGEEGAAVLWREGKVVEWTDGKGYGWIVAGEKRWFFHIKGMAKGEPRPRVGARVRFMEGMDERGRSRAEGVRVLDGGATVGGRMGLWGWLVLAVALVVPGLAAAKLHFRHGVPWWGTAGWLTVASLAAYALYGSDKGRAQRGGWRVPEKVLHLAELIGGWPGAWVAQRRLRHKCRKLEYQVVFWLIVGIYQVAGWDFLQGFLWWEELAAWLGNTGGR